MDLSQNEWNIFNNNGNHKKLLEANAYKLMRHQEIDRKIIIFFYFVDP